jgi:UDP-N-acetylmuramyl pentapeptide phosphotransferase/UDP-N-acetylglucosamine-1-phosphate transferase
MTNLLNLIPMAALASAVVSLLVAMLLVKTEHLHGHWSHDTDFGVQKIHTQPTARVGGIAIVAGMVAGYFLAYPSRQSLLWPMLLASSPAFAFGLAEDITKRVSVRARLLATMACSVLGWAITGYSVTDVNVPGLDWLLSFTLVSVIFTAVAVGGVANALNIVDGINGLASGTVLIILFSLALVTNALGDTDLMRASLILAGAVLGFALVNWPWGKIFLGDGGAYFLGFCVAWLSVLLLARHAEISAWCPLMLCACPVLEVGFTMVRRARRRHILGAPDCLHLHSLINRRLTRRLLPHASALVRNSATGTLMWCAGLLPAYIAVHWATDTSALALGFVICALLYSSVYARLTQFRWCISAQTMRGPRTLRA